MKKVCVVYASMTGNTEEIATLLANNLAEFDAQMFQMENTDVSVITEYDGILLGSYTWGDGELPDEAQDFYDQLDDVDLTGKIVGCFGSGDTLYDQYCAAVDQLQEKAKERGATVMEDGLKIELSPDDDQKVEMIHSFAKKFALTLK